MTNQEILTKAIEKAIAGGWRMSVKSGVFLDPVDHYYKPLDDLVEKIIFNHQFAKALWGDDYRDEFGPGYAWKFHLQEMVIADDPIKYLGDNI